MDSESGSWTSKNCWKCLVDSEEICANNSLGNLVMDWVYRSGTTNPPAVIPEHKLAIVGSNQVYDWSDRVLNTGCLLSQNTWSHFSSFVIVILQLGFLCVAIPQWDSWPTRITQPSAKYDYNPRRSIPIWANLQNRKECMLIYQCSCSIFLSEYKIPADVDFSQLRGLV